MTGALLLALAAALAAPLDVERARAALEAGHVAEARDYAQAAVVDDPEDFEALRLYADALDAEGAGLLALPELRGIATESVAAGVLHDELAVLAGQAEADVLGDRTGDAADLAVIALAEIALQKGTPEVALAALGDTPKLPLARSVRIGALLAAGRDADAAAATRALAADVPDRPDLLVPVFDAPATGPIKRARKAALRAAEKAARATDDPIALYRARSVLVYDDDPQAAKQVVDALVRLGEAPPLTRVPWSPAMRRGLARGLAMNRSPTLPEGTPEEIRDIALRVCMALRDMGRVQEAIAVFEAARARADSPELALAHAEQLLRMARAKDALKVAREAKRMASEPSDRDIARLNLRGWRAELAAALVMEATALAVMERPEEALESAVGAALLDPSASAWSLVGELQMALGYPEAAFTAFATARLLGGHADAALSGTWTGLGSPADAVAAITPHLAAELEVEIPAGLDLAEVEDRSRGPRMGSPAPDWAVDTGTATYDRDSTRGRVVVLAFWASWCGPCRLELPELAALARRHADDPIDFLAISVDDRVKDYTRFLSQVDLEGLAVAHDPELGAAWLVSALPSTWILDADGVVQHFHQGFGPGAEKTIAEEVRGLLEP